MKTITIYPVTRIEGHAKVTINLDDSGNVADTFVNVVELRGFEKFCIGRPVEELPRIVTSICGVCPWSHHLASAKANDAVFGVTPPANYVMPLPIQKSIFFISSSWPAQTS
jgi:F420-non-reducing hydrogenase large subunit